MNESLTKLEFAAKGSEIATDIELLVGTDRGRHFERIRDIEFVSSAWMTSLRAIGVQQQNEISIHGISTRCIQRDLLYSQMLQFPASWRKLNKINEIMAVQTARRGG